MLRWFWPKRRRATGPSKHAGDRVQRPAIFQHLGEMRRSLPVHEPGHAFS